MRAHLRPEIHPYMRNSYLPPAGAGRIDDESLRQRIRTAKERVDKSPFRK
jgi:hypothetical protein